MIRFLCTLLLLASFAACAEPDGQSPEHMVNELMAAWESGEASRLAELMAPDVVYDDIPNGRSLQGIEESIAYVTHVHEWASNIEISVDRSFGNETDAVAEWTMTATQSDPIPGRIPVATGNQIALKGATLVHVENGKITRAADYLDTLGFVLQLGSEVSLPGGVVLKITE